MTLAGAGGFILGFAALLARFNASQPVGILAGLMAGMLLLVVTLGRRSSFSRSAHAPQTLRILDDGSIELDFPTSSGEIKTGGAPHLATMREPVSDEVDHYQLAPGSLIWPGLFILRLKAVPLHPHLDLKSTPIVSIVMFKRNLSEQNRRALARLLIWAQRKTQRKTPDSSFLPSLGPPN